jgi:hypothetical protein
MRASAIAGSVLYGLLVFVGAALLGFVVAPFLAIASAAFPIEADARGFFSLLTLKGVPVLAGLSAASGYAYPSIAARPRAVRAALLAVNALVVWLVAAAGAFAVLG